jgi:uncharacterized integral membrane protein (TIGR00698 family)
MKKEEFFVMLKEGWLGLLLAIVIGLVAYFIKTYTKSNLADPLLVAMIIGILLNSVLKGSKKWSSGFVLAPLIFIPIGIIFYAAKNLNFVKFSRVNLSMIILLLFVILTYIGVILFLGEVLKQKKKITYLTATGSAICGASAIAITSPVVNADPDDVSISLLSVFVAATFGLFMLLPFLSILFGLDNQIYALLSGSVSQFTGFVKASVGTMPPLPMTIPSENVLSLALSVKAVRYLGLLIVIPLFASLVKKKLFLPWYLWAFLGAGIGGSLVYANNTTFYKEVLIPTIKPIYNILWAIAMAAIGLNMDVKQLLSNNGIKALIMAFVGFIAAVGVFLLGVSVIQI